MLCFRGAATKLQSVQIWGRVRWKGEAKHSLATSVKILVGRPND